MKHLMRWLNALTASIVMVLTVVGAQTPEGLQLLQRISLPNVAERIDHLAMDVQHQTLFVAALGNNTVEVLDLQTNQQLRTLSGMSEPQGVVFVPELNKPYVTSGGSGECLVFDGTTLDLLRSLEFASDPDNLRYDASRSLIYVGYGNGFIGVIDTATDEVVAEVRFEGHPESFQFEASGFRLFVNIPSKNQIAVLDRERYEVLTTWSTGEAHANSSTKPTTAYLSGSGNPPSWVFTTATRGQLLQT